MRKINQTSIDLTQHLVNRVLDNCNQVSSICDDPEESLAVVVAALVKILMTFIIEAESYGASRKYTDKLRKEIAEVVLNRRHK